MSKPGDLISSPSGFFGLVAPARSEPSWRVKSSASAARTLAAEATTAGAEASRPHHPGPPRNAFLWAMRRSHRFFGSRLRWVVCVRTRRPSLRQHLPMKRIFSRFPGPCVRWASGSFAMSAMFQATTGLLLSYLVNFVGIARSDRSPADSFSKVYDAAVDPSSGSPATAEKTTSPCATLTSGDQRVPVTGAQERKR